MADKRKLQGEIDRCHKKVTEGVDAFQETWKKLQQASNPNQKEKYEQDLKKEIKKLQRLRDQIKTWCASSEVKDKRTLLDDRKIIETQMETFKIVERETKTKAYSKEALGLPTKIDPVEKERQELRDWLMNTIDNINIEIDKFEADVESIHAQCKKGKNKDGDRLEELQAYITKHRWHIHNLEALLRMLDNSTVDLEDVKTIQEEVDYYLKEYQEPDFFGNEYLYDDVVDPDILNTELSFNARLPGQGSDDEDEGDEHNSILDDSMSQRSHDSFHNDTQDVTPLSPSSKSSQSKTSPHQVPSTPLPPPVPVQAAAAAVPVVVPVPVRSRHNTPNNITTQPPKPQQVPPVKPVAPVVPPSYSPTLPPSSVSNSLYNNHPMSNSSTDSSITSPTLPLSNVTNDLSMVMSNSLNPPPMDLATSLEEDPNQEAFTLDPILGVTPLGPIPLTQERLMQLEMLESASHHLPLPSDTRSRLSMLKIIPSFPVQIPPHHQHNYEPSKHTFDTYEYFQKLQPDTLFFIFYYYEGTRAQLLAAKALKEQSWRFHKKHKLWFQRYEEPKKIAETYETGTYIYFDIKQWSQRKKEDFTFEYKYLEEIQLNE